MECECVANSFGVLRCRKLTVGEAGVCIVLTLPTSSPFSPQPATRQPLLGSKEPERHSKVKFHAQMAGYAGLPPIMPTPRSGCGLRGLPELPTSVEGRHKTRTICKFPEENRCIIGRRRAKRRAGGQSDREVPEFARRHAQIFGAGTVDCLRRLRIAVVGCSGTGTPLIEQFVRLGVGYLCWSILIGLSGRILTACT